MTTVVQGGAVTGQWRNNRDVCCGKFRAERMLLQDRVVAPATWPVKFRNEWRGIFLANLVDAVFVTVKRQKSTITAKSKFVDGRQDFVRAGLLGVKHPDH